MSTPIVSWCVEISSKSGFPTSPSPTTTTLFSVFTALSPCEKRLDCANDEAINSDVPRGEGAVVFMRFVLRVPTRSLHLPSTCWESWK